MADYDKVDKLYGHDGIDEGPWQLAPEDEREDLKRRADIVLAELGLDDEVQAPPRDRTDLLSGLRRLLADKTRRAVRQAMGAAMADPDGRAPRLMTPGDVRDAETVERWHGPLRRQP